MNEDTELPPRTLSNEPTSPYFRPDLLRIGVKVNGQERNDIAFYDVDNGTFTTIRKVAGKGKIEPYWRYAATRQQRRAMERWRKKRS